MTSAGDAPLIPSGAMSAWRELAWALDAFGPTACEKLTEPDRWWSSQAEEQSLEACRRCPVQPECLDYALAADERFGVWGATTATQRRAVRRG